MNHRDFVTGGLRRDKPPRPALVQIAGYAPLVSSGVKIVSSGAKIVAVTAECLAACAFFAAARNEFTDVDENGTYTETDDTNPKSESKET